MVANKDETQGNVTTNAKGRRFDNIPTSELKRNEITIIILNFC